MNTDTSGREWYRQILHNNNLVLVDDNQSWLYDTRKQAIELLDELPLPNRKQEKWHYTNFEGLYSRKFYSQSAPITGIDNEDIDAWVYPESESYRLVFVNGKCVPALSNIGELPATIKIGSLRAALSTDKKLITQVLSRQPNRQDDIFTALNRALLSDGLFVHIGENIKLDRPVEVVYLNVNFEQNALSQPYSLILLDKGAELKLVERHISTGGSEYLFNANTQVIVDERAKLQHVYIQRESPAAFHLNRVMVSQHQASDYHVMQVSTGAAWSRTDINVDLLGKEANCELKGVYTCRDSQYTDIHLDVHHAKPECRSREDFRGILHGQGRAVFDGRIVVEKDAQHSDAQLTNKNLMLCENAEIDTKPQLEIYADDVRCGHGTTVGRIDPAQIFYMRSRGIPEEMARRMLSVGFAEQVLAGLDDSALHDFILGEIKATLSQEEESTE